MSSLYSRLVWLMIASSISSPPARLRAMIRQRDDRDLGRAAADVDDHVPSRLGDGEPGPDRGGHRLLDQVGSVPAESVTSSTARFSTPVTPDGTRRPAGGRTGADGPSG